MSLQVLAFYVFSIVAIASAVMVVSARNPVHSVLFLILAFLNASGLFILLGAEFLALILAIVYVGAVAVLFLFVVMMLDVDVDALREGFLQYLPVGALIGLVLLIELFFVLGAWVFAPEVAVTAQNAIPAPTDVSNTEALGRIIYTDYIYLFQASGLILLVAMIGAIVLTLRHREGVRRQSAGRQVSRRREEVLAVRKVGTGEGIR